MTRERQHDSRTRRDSLTDVIHAEPETFWGAYRKKLGEQPALFDHTNWVAGEHGEPLPIVPDTSNPSLKAVRIAAHKPLVEAEILEAMRKVFKLGVHLARGPSDFF
ncbi:MAG: hypothetical protein WBE89_12970 [Methyloceanibacter sp.]